MFKGCVYIWHRKLEGGGGKENVPPTFSLNKQVCKEPIVLVNAKETENWGKLI